MQYWVCYDIADDRRRTRLSGLLLDFGKRMQESVFHCLLERPLAEEMMQRIARTIEPISDKVHVISVCDTCAAKITVFGAAEVAADPEFLII